MALDQRGNVVRARQTETLQRQGMERTGQDSMTRWAVLVFAAVLGHCAVLGDVAGGKLDPTVFSG